MYNKYLDASNCVYTDTKENKMSLNDYNSKMPEFKVNQSRNGFEIRTDILGMAKDIVEAEYSAKFSGWEMSTQRDKKTGEVVSTVSMPEFPGIEHVLATAEKMYAFVSKK